MTRATSNVIVDNWSGRRSTTLDLLQIVGFSLLTALFAQIRVPLPFTPVPVTGQTLAVLLAGAVLGARRGFLSQALYLVFGAAAFGFAGGSLVGPTAGYLWSFPIAAAIAGSLVERGTVRRTWMLAFALALADTVILAAGAIWLAVSLKVTAVEAISLGIAPFGLGEVLKIAFVTIAVRYLLGRSQRTVQFRQAAP